MFPEGEVSSEVTGEVMTPAGGWRLLARAGDGSRDARLRPSPGSRDVTHVSNNSGADPGYWGWVICIGTFQQ